MLMIFFTTAHKIFHNFAIPADLTSYMYKLGLSKCFEYGKRRYVMFTVKQC